MNENGESRDAPVNRPPPQASYWVKVLENPCPVRTMTLPFQPKRPPRAMATKIKISEKWNSRFPVSRRKPFSAATEFSATSRRQRLSDKYFRPLAKTSSAEALTSNDIDSGRRSRLRGAGGGGANMARQCTFVRGNTQPISEMKRSKYTAANQGEE